MRAHATAAVLALAALAACGPNHEPDAGAVPVAADTARGVVAITGADPATRVTLRTAAGPVTLHGEAAGALRLAGGVEVRVEGERREDGGFTVRSFRVRAADGLPAVDGVLRLEGGEAVLVTADGRRVRYAPVPAGLAAHAGRHVWVAGPPDAEPQAWGVLDARR